MKTKQPSTEVDLPYVLSQQSRMVFIISYSSRLVKPQHFRVVFDRFLFRFPVAIFYNYLNTVPSIGNPVLF